MSIFGVLDCALRSRFLAPEELPTAPVWELLPSELRSELACAVTAGEPLGSVLRRLWQVRERLLGKPVLGKPDSSESRTPDTATLRLGLLAILYQEGRMEAGELLTRAFHVADSYVCGIDPRPFLRLRAELDAGSPDGGRVTALFAPYTAPAEQCVRQWGLRPGAV